MSKVILEGFKTVAEAESFCEWYAGQGEQDIEVWLESRKADGYISCDSMIGHHAVVTGDDVVMQILCGGYEEYE